MTDDPLFDHDQDPRKDIEELRRKMEVVHEKLSGKNQEKISLEDVAQYIRVVNYNFGALANIINRVAIGQNELVLNQMLILDKLLKISQQLEEFFDANSFLDDTFNKDKEGNEPNS